VLQLAQSLAAQGVGKVFGAAHRLPLCQPADKPHESVSARRHRIQVGGQTTTSWSLCQANSRCQNTGPSESSATQRIAFGLTLEPLWRGRNDHCRVRL